MPDKKSSKNDEAGDDAGKKKLPIIPIVLAVVMLGVGYFVGGMMAGGSSETTTSGEHAEDEEHAEPEVPEELGALHEIEAININLADGHYLRIAVALEGHDHGGGGGHGKDEEEFPCAPAADLLLTTFSGRSMDELSTAEGREAARVELLDAVVEKYHGEIYGLYFTEFVMQ